MFNPYKQFVRLYPKDIRWDTLVILIHLLRKTLLNVRSSTEETVSGNSGTMLMIFCVALNFYMIYKNRKYFKKAIQESKLFTWYCIYAISSILWTPVPGSGGILAKGFELLSSYLLLGIVLYKIKDVSRCLIYILFIATSAAFLGGLYTGFTHTNTYSISALVGAVISLGLYKTYKVKGIIVYAIINVLILVLGTSSASYISFLGAVGILFATNKNGVNYPLLVTVGVFGFLVYFFGLDLISEYIFYGHSQEQISSGSGREYIWDLAISSWLERPWLGWGYCVGERYVFSQNPTAFVLSSHNGFLSVLLGTGLFGMFLFGSYLIRTLYQAWKLTNSRYYRGFAAIVLAALLGVLANNMSYPVFVSDWNHPFPPVMLLFLLLNTMHKKVDNHDIVSILNKKYFHR